MTKKEMFAMAINVIAETEAPEKDTLIEGLEHEIELLNKKSASAKKPTKTQIENDGFKADIVTYLAEADSTKTIKELQAAIPSIAGLTNQRVTHLLTDLVKAGTLTKEYVKKTPYFAIA